MEAEMDKATLATRLDQIDLLLAMYPDEGEVVLDTDMLERARMWCDEGDGDVVGGGNIPSTAVLEVSLNLTLDGEGDGDVQVQVQIDVPMRTRGEDARVKVRLRQSPEWMSRARAAEINQRVGRECVTGTVDEGGEIDVFAALDMIREDVGLELHRRGGETSAANAPCSSETATSAMVAAAAAATKEPLVRVWFYFPSLSTRSKRADLVDSAPGYRLTGFVLAGKPGILCLEGTSRQVDEYMKYIKTESWGDIPSHQKKVSERYREVLDGGDGRSRVFEDMQEITEQEWMGEKRGERGNRSDLRVVEGWLKTKGLDGVLQRVLM